MGKKKKPSKDKPPASSKEAIHVLASDVAHLLINEPSTSTLPRPISTPALARIPSARDLSDDRHQALDAAILRGFQLNVQFNQQPHLAFLLSVIVNNDDRLGHLSQEEAEGLLEREPSLATVLEQAWNDQSYKEVRRLRRLLCSLRFSSLMSPPLYQSYCGVTRRRSCQANINLHPMKVRFRSSPTFCNC
jgi:hypothetical protein